MARDKEKADSEGIHVPEGQDLNTDLVTIVDEKLYAIIQEGKRTNDATK